MEGFDPGSALDTYLEQRARGVFFPPEWDGKLSLDEAYQVLLAWGARQRSERRQVGWKVGLTSPPIQRQFNVHEPGFGCLFADAVLPSGAEIGFASLERPGFENELCITLGEPLAGPGATLADAQAAVSTVAPAFELIETRGDSIGRLEAGLLDNLQQKGVILGPAITLSSAPPLSEVALTVSTNGAQVDSATGDAVLGHPLNSIVWLANKLAQFGLALSKGDVVMTGSFTRQYAINQGDSIRSEFNGIGAVEARFP